MSRVASETSRAGADLANRLRGERDVGAGFVVANEGGPDILLHANVLRNFGQSSVADAAGIDVIVQETARGIQAVEVLHIEDNQALVRGTGEDGEQS